MKKLKCSRIIIKTVASDQNLHPSFLNVKSQQNPIIEQELQANSSLDPEVNEVSLLNRKFVMSELKNALNKKKKQRRQELIKYTTTY